MKTENTFEPEVVVNKGVTLTDEQVQAMCDILGEVTAEEASLPSNNGVLECEREYIAPEDIKSAVVTETIDVNTGIVNTTPVEDSTDVDLEMAKLLNISVDELYKMPETIDEIEIDDEFFKKNLSEGEFNISDEDIVKTIPLIKEFRKNPEQNWYDKLPAGIIKEIDIICGEIKNNSLSYKKFVARQFLEQIVVSSGMDKVIVDMQATLNKAFDAEKPFMRMAMDFCQTSMETELFKRIDSLKAKVEELDVETAAKDIEIINRQIDNYQRLADSIRESYMITDLIEKVKAGKIKVKKKHTNKYKRHCQDFLFKYRGDTAFVIDDITICVPILCRLLPMFTPVELGNSIIAFTMQCMNYSSKDVYQHSYMYYFIRNIKNLTIALDDEEHTEFSKVLLGNLFTLTCLVNGIEEESLQEELDVALNYVQATSSVVSLNEKVTHVPTDAERAAVLAKMKEAKENRKIAETAGKVVKQEMNAESIVDKAKAVKVESVPVK